MLAVSEDIRNDTSIIETYILQLKYQETGANLIIPKLESKDNQRIIMSVIGHLTHHHFSP